MARNLLDQNADETPEFSNEQPNLLAQPADVDEDNGPYRDAPSLLWQQPDEER